jgi:hypothetical protein
VLPTPSARFLGQPGSRGRSRGANAKSAHPSGNSLSSYYRGADTASLRGCTAESGGGIMGLADITTEAVGPTDQNLDRLGRRPRRPTHRAPPPPRHLRAPAATNTANLRNEHPRRPLGAGHPLSPIHRQRRSPSYEFERPPHGGLFLRFERMFEQIWTSSQLTVRSDDDQNLTRPTRCTRLHPALEAQ